MKTVFKENNYFTKAIEKCCGSKSKLIVVGKMADKLTDKIEIIMKDKN